MNPSEKYPRSAFDQHNEAAEFPCLLVCEHASNYIPPAFAQLGLSSAQTNTHIGWDIGARALLDHLATDMACTALACNYSRLLIDCNRPVDVVSCIPDISEIHTVPGNRDLCEVERQQRIDYIYKPFHAAVELQVGRLKAKHATFPVIGIHSFTPVFNGERRPWKFSVMWKVESPFVCALIEHFKQHEINEFIGYNEPYSAKTIRAHTTEYYADVHQLPTVIFEVRQDLLDDPGAVEYWSNLIKLAVLEALSATNP